MRLPTCVAEPANAPGAAEARVLGVGWLRITIQAQSARVIFGRPDSRSGLSILDPLLTQVQVIAVARKIGQLAVIAAGSYD
jgi:hypothetical protein